jgi:hypothetical protein
MAPLLVAAALAGCVRRPHPGPPPELLAARTAVVQAQANPLAPLAVAELKRAEQALAIAEHEARERPLDRSARDAAYVARRRAQCSQLASLVRANLEALQRGRRALEALRARAAARPTRDTPGATPGAHAQGDRAQGGALHE